MTCGVASVTGTGYRVLAAWLALSIAVGCASGCDTSSSDAPDSAQAVSAALQKPAQVLIFPESMQVEDESVNAFVKKAMAACAKGDYGAFRLLWSARQEPLPQAEFDAGWKAVQAIRIRSLDHIRMAVKSETGDEDLRDHYVFVAEVQFDPQRPAGRKEPTRQVVLLMGKEQGQWRLARAPEKIRSWARAKLPDAGTENDPTAVTVPTRSGKPQTPDP